MKYRFQNVLLQNFHIQRSDRIRGNTELRGQHIPAPADEHADFALPCRPCHRIIRNRLKAFADFDKNLTLVKVSKSQNNTVIIQNLQLIIRKNDTEDIVERLVSGVFRCNRDVLFSSYRQPLPRKRSGDDHPQCRAL